MSLTGDHNHVEAPDDYCGVDNEVHGILTCLAPSPAIFRSTSPKDTNPMSTPTSRTREQYTLDLDTPPAALAVSESPVLEFISDDEYTTLPEQDWCPDCDTPREIIDTTFETEGFEEQESAVLVQHLSCSHHNVSRLVYAMRPPYGD